jgi:hypothetical protein
MRYLVCRYVLAEVHEEFGSQLFHSSCRNVSLIRERSLEVVHEVEATLDVGYFRCLIAGLHDDRGGQVDGRPLFALRVLALDLVLRGRVGDDAVVVMSAD